MKPADFIQRYGIRAFPCARGGKEPWHGFTNNLNRATADMSVLRHRAKMYKGCNWGASLALSGLVVMDIDVKPGQHGRETFASLSAEHGPLPETLTVTTPSGGLHYYFKQTNAVHFYTGRKHAFGPGVDAPGYVVIPGSVLASGRYMVTHDAPIANAPEWFAIYLPAAERGEVIEQEPVIELDQTGNIAWAIDWLKRFAPPALQGRGGEETLLLVAGTLKDHGISQGMAVDLLCKYYNERCEPQWSVGDGATADRLDVKVANAFQYLKHVQPGAATAEADFGDDIEEFAS